MKCYLCNPCSAFTLQSYKRLAGFYMLFMRASNCFVVGVLSWRLMRLAPKSPSFVRRSLLHRSKMIMSWSRFYFSAAYMSYFAYGCCFGLTIPRVLLLWHELLANFNVTLCATRDCVIGMYTIAWYTRLGRKTQLEIYIYFFNISTYRGPHVRTEILCG